MNVNVYKTELEKERRARLAATQLFEQKHQALKEAHHDLSQHSLRTAEKVVDQRAIIDRLTQEKAGALLEVERYKELLAKAPPQDSSPHPAQSVFLTKMSHEFRTPLNGVINMADELCESLTDEDLKKCADTIKASGERLLGFTDKLLLYSEISGSAPKLKQDSINVPKLLNDCLSQPSARLDSDDVSIILDVLPDFPTLIGDGQRISQILRELLSNAVSNTEHGTIVMGSAWRVAGDVHEVLFWVQDTGVGIDPDLHDHILGDFSQVEDGMNRRRDGAGIGLSIVSKLVDAMGGDLELSSIEGKGSRFDVSLPLEIVDAVPPKTPALDQLLLIISEDILQRVSLTRSLEFLGIETDEIDVIPDTIEDDVAGVLVSDTLLGEFKKLHPDTPVFALSNESIADTSVSVPTTFADIVKMLDVLVPKQLPKILAADDNKTNQLVFKNMVKNLDIDLKIVSDGEEAVQAYHDFSPSMIFMDISMPKMDGLEATQAIRWYETEKGIPPIKIIAMTAHAMDGDEDRIKSAGVDVYMTKPLKKTEIVQAIEDCVNDKERKQAS